MGASPERLLQTAGGCLSRSARHLQKRTRGTRSARHSLNTDYATAKSSDSGTRRRQDADLTLLSESQEFWQCRDQNNHEQQRSWAGKGLCISAVLTRDLNIHLFHHYHPKVKKNRLLFGKTNPFSLRKQHQMLHSPSHTNQHYQQLET